MTQLRNQHHHQTPHPPPVKRDELVHLRQELASHSKHVARYSCRATKTNVGTQTIHNPQIVPLILVPTPSHVGANLHALHENCVLQHPAPSSVML